MTEFEAEAFDDDDETVGLAPWWSRGVGLLIDGFIVGGAAKLLLYLAGNGAADYLLIVQSVLLYVMATVLLSSSRAATVGMMLVGIRVTDLDGTTALAPSRVALRGLLPMALMIGASFLPLVALVSVLALLWPLLMPMRQTPWDQLARNLVVVDWRSAKFR